MEKFGEITDFIKKQFNNQEDFISLHEPRFCGNERKYVLDAIESTFVSSVGKYVDMFEKEIANFTGAAKAVACVNGTNALHLALVVAGVNAGDEVISQDITFVATLNAISYTGANPILVDIDKDTLGMSPKALNEWLTENAIIVTDNESKKLICKNKNTDKKISACVPMHTFGHPCRIDEIIEICNEYYIPVIEDAAESLGSYSKQKHTGTSGLVGVLSFNGNKIITTGGGGMLLFNDIDLATRAKHLSTQAKIPHPWEFKHDETGYNYRMPNLNAAIGLAQLEQINTYLESKRKLAENYKKFFDKLNIPFISEPKNAKSNYWLNAILLKDKEERNDFLTFTNKNGVMTRPVWEPIHQLPMYKDVQCGKLENSIWIADRLVNIPSSVIL